MPDLDTEERTIDKGDGGTEVIAPADDEPEWSPEVEEIALELGWKPKDQFDPSKGEWKSPREFISNTRKVVFDSRDKTRNLEGKLARVAAQVAKLQGNQRTQADRDAQEQLAAAVEAGDLEAANRVLQQERQRQAPADEHPAFTSFKERNAAWYDVDEDATALAAAQDARIAKRDGITDPEAHMRKVEAAVRKAYPQLFGEEAPKADTKGAQSRAPLVARASSAERPGNNGQVTVNTMTKDMREAAKAAGVSPESYVKSYNDLMSRPTRNRAA